MAEEKKQATKEPCAAILIASSYATSGLDKGVAARKNVDKKNPKGNLMGSKIDVTNMYQLFLKTKIIKVVKTFDSIDDEKESTRRQEILDSIGKMFNDTDRETFILYYSGHGRAPSIEHNRNGGDWCFEGRDQHNNKITTFITLNDILSLWQNRTKPGNNKKQRLIIIADCCYSGGTIFTFMFYFQYNIL